MSESGGSSASPQKKDVPTTEVKLGKERRKRIRLCLEGIMTELERHQLGADRARILMDLVGRIPISEKDRLKAMGYLLDGSIFKLVYERALNAEWALERPVIQDAIKAGMKRGLGWAARAAAEYARMRPLPGGEYAPEPEAGGIQLMTDAEILSEMEKARDGEGGGGDESPLEDGPRE